MKKLCLISVLLILGVVSGHADEPIGLEWEKKHKVTTVPAGWRQYMGTIDDGLVILLGQESLLSMEQELQIVFTNDRKLARATLILGPRGLDHENCLKKFKKVISVLNRKYGEFKYKLIERDPVVDELIYASACYPVSLGLYYLEYTWYTETHIIKASLVGDDSGLYIEIEYSHRGHNTRKKSQDARRVLKRF